MSFFKNLNSSRIFVLFFAAFSIGTLSIWFNIYPIWIPIIATFLFWLVVYISHKKYFISLSSSDKNYPYFLGFLFTLVALFYLFFKPRGVLSAETVYQSLSVAIITTIVGLILRLQLISLSSINPDEADLMRSLREQLNENIEKYNEAQAKILSLLNDYSAGNESILKNEMRIADKFQSSLQKATAIFDRLENDFTPRISLLTQSLTKFVENLKSSLENILPESFTEDMSKRLSLLHDDYIKRINEGVGSLLTAIKHISADVVAKVEKDFVNTLKNSSDVLNETCRDYATSVGMHTLTLEDYTKKVSLSAKDIVGSIDSYMTRLTSINENMLLLYNNLHGQISSSDSILTERLANLRKELDAIDKLIESFISVTTDRLKS
jgi:flagellar hook-basal body complex protein FliE